MYDKVAANQDFVSREEKVLKFWKDNSIFEESMKERENNQEYMWYEGPPTANGKPHIGHVLTRVVKDVVLRFHAMEGYNVPRRAGWDTHGLPVEIEVEKKLGLDGKDQIEKYGIEPFIKQCKESVWKYKGMWEQFSDAVGFWADLDNAYVTYRNPYIESEWWALKQIWDKGLLYKGYRVVPYCPRCGTPLSSHEVAQGYKALTEKSAIVRFQVKGADEYFLAWTTTPWTLASNTALCVNPKEEYCKVKAADGYTYILAKALLDTVLGSLAKDGQPAYEILDTCIGKDMEYMEYVPLFQCAQDRADKAHKKAFFVTCDNYVTMTDGTGIVHIAPAFGEDDARIGRDYDLPLIQFVDEKGRMSEETPFAGMRCKPSEHELEQDPPAISADPEVLKYLEEKGQLFSAPVFTHDYPHCWRCDTPLLYYARESWFIKMTAVRDDLVRNNKTVNWYPASIGTGRFGKWLENIQDWDIGRNHYWGTPLNVWECKECGHMESIGSIAELQEKSDNCPADIELHRPYLDSVTIKCPHCGKPMHRVPEVIDCWFDSGSMPFAQLHYPFENQELFKQQFPADFITEAVDQTRGWFYSLMAISTLIFNCAPYRNCISMGHVLDGNGQKMSKSKGNAVDPMEALKKYGADAIRWYFCSNSAPWLPSRFHEKAVLEGRSKFIGTLYNTYAFYVLYAEIDKFDPTKYKLEYDKLPVMDKWILSRLTSTAAGIKDDMDHYKIQETTKLMQDFVDDLSNWYLRRSRSRFWAKGMEQDKINAYMTLYTVLVDFCKVSAFMIPFMTEEIYRNIVVNADPSAPKSIHLCDLPQIHEDWVDADLEENMKNVLHIVVQGRACRNAANIKNRQPLGKMYVKASFELSQFYKEIIENELNIKEVLFTDDVSMFTTYTFKPQLRTVGPKYGKKLNFIRNYLTNLDGNAAMAELKAKGALSFDAEGVPVELTEEDLLIDSAQMPGFVADTEYDTTVVIDTNLTEELIEEGFVREVISKIQTMRKEAGFEVMDRIHVYLTGSDKVKAVVGANKDQISREVLANDFTCDTMDGYSKEWNLNGEAVALGVKKENA